MEETDYTLSNKFANGINVENPHGCCFDDNEVYHELYLYEIFEGKPEIQYKGIYPLIHEYMNKKMYKKEDIAMANIYLQFVLARAKGEVKTGAKYLREIVLNHQDYK